MDVINKGYKRWILANHLLDGSIYAALIHSIINQRTSRQSVYIPLESFTSMTFCICFSRAGESSKRARKEKEKKEEKVKKEKETEKEKDGKDDTKIKETKET